MKNNGMKDSRRPGKPAAGIGGARPAKREAPVEVKTDEERFPERDNDVIFGRNSVQEAINGTRPVDSVLVAKGERTGSVPHIIALAKEKGIVVKEVDRKKLDYMCANGNHQGIAAIAAVKEYSSVEDIFALAAERNEPPFIIVCDEIEDPHNLGAIIRTAEAAGAHGVIVPKRHSPPLSFAVSKTSAGAVEHMLIARVGNLPTAIDELKKQNVWVCCADMDGTPYYEADLSGAIAVVIGSEGKGVGRLVKERCDFSVSLPMKGKVNSLNASVAAGILMYAVCTHRTKQ